jgi:hypothetical protein
MRFDLAIWNRKQDFPALVAEIKYAPWSESGKRIVNHMRSGERRGAITSIRTAFAITYTKEALRFTTCLNISVE